jgi:hypothetical protein
MAISAPVIATPVAIHPLEDRVDHVLLDVAKLPGRQSPADAHQRPPHGRHGRSGG